jgi:hypothetical protein
MDNVQLHFHKLPDLAVYSYQLRSLAPASVSKDGLNDHPPRNFPRPGYQKPRPARLKSLPIGSKIYADSYKTLAIAFNATLRNIRN